jgi:predicted Zn finger-like uncharacterized protein
VIKNQEIRIRELLEHITYDELAAYAEQEIRYHDEEIFICPSCGAQYKKRVLRVSVEGQIECQNCNELFTPEEIEVTDIIRQREEDSFVCPNCSAQFLWRDLSVTSDGRVECSNCRTTYDPIELDVAQRSDS